MRAKPKSTRGRNALSGVDLRAQYVGPGRRLQVVTCQQIAGLKQETGGKVKEIGIGMLTLAKSEYLYNDIEITYLERAAMPVHIRDRETLDLVDQVMSRLGAKTRTEAVRVALENKLKDLMDREHREQLLKNEVPKDGWP